jgi:hypothetical protein
VHHVGPELGLYERVHIANVLVETGVTRSVHWPVVAIGLGDVISNLAANYGRFVGDCQAKVENPSKPKLRNMLPQSPAVLSGFGAVSSNRRRALAQGQHKQTTRRL